MKKVVLIFDGGQYAKGAMEFCQTINDREPILLVGSFLPGIDFTGMSEIYGYGALDIPLHIRVDETVVDSNIAMFEKYCIQHQIEYRVHKDLTLDAYPAFHKETRFADLAVIGSQEFLGQLALNIPAENLRDALHAAECPIIVIPDHYKEPTHIVLAYDGSASATFAIKMFSYLFPDLCEKTTILLNVSENGHIPSSIPIQEYGKAHYSRFQVLVLGKIDLFENWIKNISSPVLVTGAFGRSGLSLIFKTGFADKALSDFSFPVFIAHL